MTRLHAKPKLVFFQYRYDATLPEFLLIHKRDHVKCLSAFFDVTVIHDDCDYQQICDTYEPDLALFESGVNHTTCQRLAIRNIRSCPNVPKVALHNADAFCNARAGFLSDMDHWGIETFFAITVTAPEHTPEIADNFFIWPNCIDPETYRDYGIWKSIPVLFTGNTNPLYPWRHQILRLVTERYPSMTCPHPGYEPGKATAHVFVGERYARLINASMMVPACGTVAKDVVRKHFEIPACRSLLVAERSQGLEAAGFVDMESCVFADGADVLDKLNVLFHDPERLDRITQQGFELAHTRHTLNHRDQIFQWYTLNRQLQPNQRIIQTSPFDPLIVVDRSSGKTSGHVRGEGVHLELLRRGNELLRRGKHVEAEQAFLKCMNYMRWMPEPKLGLARCRLYGGDAKTAHRLVAEQIEFILGGYGALDPDPVEWAYYLVSLLCLGKAEEAIVAARRFAWLHHPELDRARRVVAIVTGDHSCAPSVFDGERRRTIHRLPAREWSDWVEQVRLMLHACGQTRFGEQLKGSDETPASPKAIAPAAPISPPQENNRSFKRSFRKRTERWEVKRSIARALHRVEKQFGYFLPYELSEMKRDEFLGQLSTLVAAQQIRYALLVGCGGTTGSIEALLAGMADTRAAPRVFCVDRLTRKFRRFEKTFAGRVACVGVPASSAAELPRRLDESANSLRRTHHIDRWDAVLVCGEIATAIGDDLQQELRRAGLAIFDGINTVGVYTLHDSLLNDRDYALVAHNAGLRNGYAIFKRTRLVAPASVECAAAPAAIA